MEEILLKVTKEGDGLRASVDCPGRELQEALSFLIFTVMESLKDNGASDELIAAIISEIQAEAFAQFFATPEGQDVKNN